MDQKIKLLLGSGIIESYVMGWADEREQAELNALAASYPEVRQAIDVFEKELEDYLVSKAVLPSLTAKPELMAKIEYYQRISSGEKMSMPPLLHKGSVASDYRQWLAQPGMQLPEEAENITAKIIGATTETTISVVWIKKSAPEEIHTNELESFLILEGTCIITVAHERFLLAPGDHFSIPLHTPHHVLVTSSIPCKAILQRIAA
jgi:mannose-6-phosphate isomerase-like protein (cupin superfamily)